MTDINVHGPQDGGSPLLGTVADGENAAVPGSRPAVILGNGPSLRGFDLKRLGDYDVFGMNAAYRHWDEIGWYPQFYSCLDTVVGVSHAEEIARLVKRSEEYGIRLFLLRGNLFNQLKDLPNHWKLVNFDHIRVGDPLLCPNAITTGSHTLAWAASLGYRSIALMGMDCNYKEIVAGAEVVEGAVLEIIEEAENPNYFFDGYQRKGDRFHVPNPGREVHVQGWREVAVGIDGVGARVLNANPISRVDAFDFCDPELLFSPEAYTRDGFERLPILRESRVRPNREPRPVEVGVRTYRRSDEARISETEIVARLLCKDNCAGVIFDVGAHYGSSSAPFVERGWKAYCFEPDDENRAKLADRFESNPSVVIDCRGIDEVEATDRPFFRSGVSSGISSLAPFHESHSAQEGLVSVTTVAHAAEQYGIDSIDFLKIDVEGFERSVLKGVPWERFKPRVVECEFEDAKTAPLGYGWKDLAAFLRERGYTVYVSEWHPIVQYGIGHDWRVLKRYPCELEDPKGWGNLIAFLEDPGDECIASVASGVLTFPTKMVARADVAGFSNDAILFGDPQGMSEDIGGIGPTIEEMRSLDFGGTGLTDEEVRRRVIARRRLHAARGLLKEHLDILRRELASVDEDLRHHRSSKLWIFSRSAWNGRSKRNSLKKKIDLVKQTRNSLEHLPSFQED